MFTFIAGDISTGQVIAMAVVVSISSAIPKAIFPITLADAGATSITSAREARETWEI